MVQIGPATVGMIDIRLDEDRTVRAVYYDFQDRVPLPRRRVARILRDLAENMEETADELERLEH